MLELISSKNQSYIDTDKNGEYIVESDLTTLIPAMFGGDADIFENGKNKTDKWKGKVIFLDAYPEKVPDLHVDIMNPHYGAYYTDEKGEIPPADYLDPTPIKFLTVRMGTVFEFRALVPMDSGLLETVKTSFKKALTEEGVGAKTAVGYGRFEIKRESNAEVHDIERISRETKEHEAKSNLDKMLHSLNLLKASELGKISGEIVNYMEKELTTNEEKTKVAKAIKEKLEKKAFKKLDRNKNGYLSECISKEQK